MLRALPVLLVLALGRVKGRKLGTARVSAQTLKAGRGLSAGTKVGLTLKPKRVKRRR